MLPKRLLLAILLLSFFSTSQIAAQTYSSKGDPVFGVAFERGSIFIQSADVQDVKKSYPKSYSFEYSRWRRDTASFTLCRTFLRHGYNLSYFNFDNSILGHGFVLSTFIEPIYRIGHSFQFQFRGDAGISYLSRPFDSTTNPGNKNYSQRFTPFFHLGAGVGFRLGRHFIIEGNGNIKHFSNGNMKQPNAGLNTITLSGSLLYFPGGNTMPVYHLKTSRNWTDKRARVDIGWMFVPGQPYLARAKSTRNYMTGFYTQVARQVSPIDAITLGAEIYYNDFSDAPDAPPHNSRPALLTGIHVGHEFLMGRIIFSQQLGSYVTDHPGFYPSLYHRWGLRYELSKHWFAGFNLKAHGKAADFFDFRVQYRF